MNSVVLAGILAWGALTGGQMQAVNGVPGKLLAKFTRGVNVTRWFCYGPPNDTKNYESYLTEGDLKNFRRLGVHFVRLCVSPDVIYRDGRPDATNLPYLDRAIDKLESSSLAVVFDLHDNGQLKLDATGRDNSGLVRFWEEIARHYKGRQTKATVFELVNEPVFMSNPEVWYSLQKRTVDAIRAIDHDRTVMVSGTRWSSIDTLSQMHPLEAKNLIYTFHCYDPFVFTHQGASWAGDQQKALRDVPFPSSPEAVAAMIDKIPDAYKKVINDYGAQRCDKAFLRRRIATAMTWGARARVPVVLGEFGAYPPVSPPDSRGRWFDAMREILQELGTPNAVWGYDDALGLGRRLMPDGKVKLDPVTLTHLYGLAGS